MVKKAGKRKVRKKASRRKVAKRKVTKKRKVTSKKYAKKKTARRLGSKRKAKKKKRMPAGYRRRGSGPLIVPDNLDNIDTVVEPSKLVAGIKSAKVEVQKIADELIDSIDGYDVVEIAFSVSFSADGKFLGVGVGGATSIEIKLTPSDE